MNFIFDKNNQSKQLLKFEKELNCDNYGFNIRHNKND